MTKAHFTFEDKLDEIRSQFLLKNGWLKIYESTDRGVDDSDGIYCCLVSNSRIKDYSENYDWPLHLGREGKPSVFGDNTYKTYDQEGLEPFLFYKHFSLPENSLSYIDISEEFVLYFRLYEKGNDKQNRTFYYIDDYGEMDEVIKVEPNLIKVKTKYLKEYITIRDMHFVVCFDFMRLLSKVPQEWQISFKDQTTREEAHVYNHLIRDVIGKTQSWMMGKVFVKPNKEKRTHFDHNYSSGESFIVGYDEKGDLIYQSCASESESAHFTLTYFKKEVLNKYYNDPGQYKVDGFGVSSKYFNLKIDNNVTDYVPVFLRDLRVLSQKEQLHWKQYNIAPTDKMGISNSYYSTMIQGQWAERPETPDLFFKSKYKEFNQKWEKKLGWKLYKPFSEQDEYLFTSLHQITTNNIKAFCEQTLTVVKLTIDRLNEKELIRGLNLESNIRGISKFEKFLESRGMHIPDMFVFLRHLQSLRSGLIAHSFSESNKDCKSALEYFHLDTGNYIDALHEIFIKSVYTFNTLEKYFDLDN